MGAESPGLLEGANDGHALRRRGHHLVGARLAMAPGVLARVVDVEAVVRVLDHRHPQPTQAQRSDQLLDQRGLARTGVTGETHHLHGATILQTCGQRSRM